MTRRVICIRAGVSFKATRKKGPGQRTNRSRSIKLYWSRCFTPVFFQNITVSAFLRLAYPFFKKKQKSIVESGRKTRRSILFMTNFVSSYHQIISILFFKYYIMSSRRCQAHQVGPTTESFKMPRNSFLEMLYVRHEVWHSSTEKKKTWKKSQAKRVSSLLSFPVLLVDMQL